MKQSLQTANLTYSTDSKIFTMKYYFLSTKTDLFNNSGQMTKIISNKLKPMVWIIATILATTFFSCEKDDDPFKECRKHPDCEYFTCKINGKRWEPRCISEPLFGCTPWDLQYYRKTSGNMGMYIKNESLKQNFTFLTRNQILKIGNNKLYKDEFIQTFFSDGRSSNCNIFSIDTLSTYSFNITKIDTLKYFLTGRFNFKGRNVCGEEVLITDGEFNLPYRF